MLYIHLLGSIRLLNDGSPLKFTVLPKTPQLLAFLLLAESAPAARTTLAYLLWPDTSEAEARSNLRRHLHDLRRALPSEPPGRPWLLVETSSLAWNRDADYGLDVDAFRAAAQDPMRQTEAVALYGGDLLESIYEDWLFYPRERLRALFFDCLLALLQRQRQAGEVVAALTTAQRILQHDPMREDVVREIMALRLDAGDRAGALAEYQRFERRLRSELQLAPMPETQALYDRLARQGLATFTPATGLPGLLPAASDEASSGLPPTNLPAPVTVFVGRETELAALQQLMAAPDSGARLITLTGPGGAGKSRLALEFAARLYTDHPQAFPDGIFAVWLAPLAAPDQVLRAIANVFNLAEPFGQTLLQTLKTFLAAKRVLLILDNFEHLLPAAPPLLELLGAAPHLRILTTSRTLLRVYGEQEFTVRPLPLPSIPDDHERQAVEAMARVASVSLFVARSRAVNPQFVLNADNAAAVAELCIRLDGLPLAIELAAARTRLLPPAAMLARLGNRLEFLSSGSRLQEERHQTLRATLDWSYQLLGAREQRVFALLSIFPTTFTLEAAEAVVRGCTGGDGLEEIEALVDNSLLFRSDVEGQVRLRMLATVRAYAREYLRQQGDWEAASLHHAETYLALAERLQPQLFGPGQAQALAALELDHLNLRAALAYAAAQRPMLGLRLATALQRYWLWSSHRGEGREWLERLLALPGAQTNPTIYLKARISAAHLTYHTSDTAFADLQSVCAACVRDARASGDNALLADALRREGDLLADHDPDRALTNLEECLALAIQMDDSRMEAGARLSLAILYVIRGDIATAQGLFAESRAFFERMRDMWSVSFITLMFAQALHHARNELDAAYGIYEEGSRLARQSGDRMYYAFALVNMADIALTRQDYAKVDTLAREALALFRELGEAYQAPRLVRLLGLVAQARGNLAAASAAFYESFELNRQLDDRRGMAAALVALAGVVWQRELPRLAAEILAGVDHLLEHLRLALLPADQTVFDQVWQAARAGLDAADFDAACAAGRGQELTALVAAAERGLSRLAHA
jgi:predicted ATPase/DNA-binding SARP family transcriptional activator